MLPEPEFQLYPLGPDGYSVIYPEEVDSLPAILRLHHETFILASRLGFLAADLRKGSLSPTFWNGSMSPTSFSDAIHQSNKLMDIQHGLRILWGSANAVYLCQRIDSLPQRSREILQQVSSNVNDDLSEVRSKANGDLMLTVMDTIPRLSHLLLYQHVAGAAPRYFRGAH